MQRQAEQTLKVPLILRSLTIFFRLRASRISYRRNELTHTPKNDLLSSVESGRRFPWIHYARIDDGTGQKRCFG
jgi:hypothetical protein